MPPPPSAELLGLLQRLNPEVQRLALRAREFVHFALRPKCETPYDANYAVSIGFGDSARMKDWVVYVAAYSKHVNIGFIHGAALDDPLHLLKGAGKQMRHVQIKTSADLSKPGLAELVASAAGTRKDGMNKTKPANNPAIDAYIANAQPFAQPILRRLRKLVHQACPDVEEELKWRCPHFSYKGMFCGMAAFKEHCTFGFWKQSLLKGRGLSAKDERAMAAFDCIRTLKDLPGDATLTRVISLAKQLNDDGVKPVKRKLAPAKDRVVSVPAAFQKALKVNKKAKDVFAKMSYSHKKEYVEWITEAKTEPTRDRRIATAIEWLGEGKSRNWKY